MRRYHNILVAYDGSEDSILALETAEAYAMDNNSDLTVIYVYDDYSAGYSRYGTEPPPNEPNLMQSEPFIGPGPMTTHTIPTPPGNHPVPEESESDKVLADARIKLSDDIKATFESLHGKPADRLIHYADHNHIDLIIMGNRGLSGIKKLVMGSVSQKVVNNSNCAVFIVK